MKYFNGYLKLSSAMAHNGLQLPEGREFEDEINLKNEDSFTIKCSF